MSFIHLHLHDKYSILDGLGDVEDFASRAVELGMPALAETNHGNLYGSYKFWKACKARSIKPILGQEFYVVPDRFVKEVRTMYHLTLLAKNTEGWKNLCKLSSLGFVDGFYYKPRIDYDLLMKYKDGLICLSGCIFGQVGSLFLENKTQDAMNLNSWYRDLFEDDYYMELMPHRDERQKSLNHFLLSLGGKAVVTNDCHYVRKEDEKYQAYLLKVQTSSNGKKGSFEFGIKDLHLKTRDEMLKDLVEFHQIELPEAENLVVTTFEISDKIEVIEFDKSHKVPTFGGVE